MPQHRLVSPGVKVREVDLTVGRIDSIAIKRVPFAVLFLKDQFLAQFSLRMAKNYLVYSVNLFLQTDSTSTGTLRLTTFSMEHTESR